MGDLCDVLVGGSTQAQTRWRPRSAPTPNSRSRAKTKVLAAVLCAASRAPRSRSAFKSMKTAAFPSAVPTKPDDYIFSSGECSGGGSGGGSGCGSADVPRDGSGDGSGDDSGEGGFGGRSDSGDGSGDGSTDREKAQLRGRRFWFSRRVWETVRCVRPRIALAHSGEELANSPCCGARRHVRRPRARGR